MSVDVAVLITEASPADFLNPPPSLSPSPSPSPPRPPAAAPAPPQPTFPRTPASATAPELERKIARLKTEFQIRDRSRQKRNEIFQSLKQSDHTKMLQLMDANEKINRLEAELQMTKNNNVIWLRRAEKFKAERYMRFAPLLDQIPTIPPPRAIEWGILARQVEFWVGVVVFIMLLAAIYAVGRYLGNYAPAVSFLPSLSPNFIILVQLSPPIPPIPEK